MQSPAAVDAVPTRRRFLARVSAALAALAAALVAVPAVGFVVAPLRRRALGAWRPLGPVDAFAIGRTVQVTFVEPSETTWSAESANAAAWLRRTGPDTFIAFAVNCTHLGCPVRWIPDAQLFMCPCHGGVFDADGGVKSGPPPRPLTRYPVMVQRGQVMIRTQNLPLA